MTGRARTTVIIACLLTALVGERGGAQQPPSTPPPQTGTDQAPVPSPQPPVFRTGINFVRVDVIVTNSRGEAVADLQPGDFEVLEDGRPQSIEAFRLVHVDGSVQPGDEPPREIRTTHDEEIEAARDDVRVYAILFDDYHVRRGSSLGVRDPLTRFVQTRLGDADLMGMMYPLTPLADVRLTRNRDQMIAAIQGFTGRKFDYTPRNEMEEKYAYQPSAVVERIRNEVTLSALKALVVHLGSLREGRKAVIVVTEGFTNTLPDQLNDPVAIMPGFGNPSAGVTDPGTNNRQESMEFFAAMDLERELRDVADAANRNNTALYMLDPRGLAAFEFDINERVGVQQDAKMLSSMQDTLRTLAEQTDGRAIVNRNDLDAGLGQIVRDSSAYYLIGYNSAQAPTDGRFHEIKVRVKRPGVQVRSRRGYWALTPDEATRATAPPKPGLPSAVQAAFGSLSVAARGRVIRTWIGSSRGEDGKTRVTFVWEPVPAPAGRRGDEPARVSVLAVGDEGAPYFRGRVPDVTRASAAGTSRGASEATGTVPQGPVRVSFDAKPGKLQLKLSVEGTEAQVLDSDLREMTLPDFTGPTVALSTPAVYRARTPRDFQALLTARDASPVVTREFSRTERLLVRFEAYGPGTSRPVATARLLNRGGSAMLDLPVTPPDTPGVPSWMDLPLSNLAAGEYLIEIKAREGDDEATELVPIRVVG